VFPKVLSPSQISRAQTDAAAWREQYWKGFESAVLSP
jgi:hypothetical protein